MFKIVSETILSDPEWVKHKAALISLVKAADTSISGIFVEQLEDWRIKLPESRPANWGEFLEIPQRNIKTIHPVIHNGNEVEESIFDLKDESTGTIKFIGAAAYIVSALFSGAVIIIDELDKNLHPLLTRMLVNLFHDPDANPHNAQLVFSSHDVSLIDRELFRRDQIYLLDKGIGGASTIGRLSDFTGISKIAPLMKWYMAGMFNAVPATNSSQIQFNFEETPEHA